MRIALIYDAVYPFVIGGAEHRYYALARLWCREHRVTVVGLRYWERGAESPVEGCRYVGVAAAVPLYDRRGSRRMAEAAYFAASLVPWLGRSDDELWDVASFPYLSVVAARIVSMLRRRPKLVVTWLEFWGEYWNEYLGPLAFLGRWAERLAMSASPYVIAISARTRSRLVAAGYPPERIKVIPIGVDLDLIDDVPPRERDYDLIYAGRLIAHKRVDLTIEAVAVLRDSGRAVRLAIVGDGPETVRLKELAVALGVEEHVDFLGRVATEREVYAHLKSARVMVVPSKREGFGMSVVQGWACGLPAVVCDEPVNALVDLIDRPEKGRVVQASPSQVAKACVELLDDDSPGRSTLLKQAASVYRWESLAEQILGVYRRVLDDAPSLSPYDAPGRETVR